MNSIAILKELITRLEAYENSSSGKKDLNIDDFTAFIQTQPPLASLQSNLIEKGSPYIADSPHNIEINIERIITQHLIVLNRYIKFYGKTALQDSSIKTLEEFSFMITIMQFQQLSKSELIRRNIIEKSSGTEIINRLIKNGLMLQVNNPNDNRSQLMALSEAGKTEIFRIFKHMDTLGKIACGPLTENEKHRLALILKKLDEFHHDNYTHKSLSELEDYLP